MKKIKITCKAAAMISIDKLEAFQGNLKSLNEKDYKKFRKAIEKHGFSFPVFVWKSDKNHFIIDGHQRLNTVRQMIREGWILKDNLIPIDWIEAKTKKEAKEKILLAMSQYGKYTEESLYEFIQVEGLDFGEEKEKIDLPQIDLEKFEEGCKKKKSSQIDSEFYTLMFHFLKDDAAYVQKLLHRNRENHKESLDEKWRERCLLRILKKKDFSSEKPARKICRK